MVSVGKFLVRCPGTSDAFAGRVITLSSAASTALATVHTWADLASYVKSLHQRSGLSLIALEKIGRSPVRIHKGLRDLPKSTVHDALNGKRPLKKDLLVSLLVACQVDRDERDAVIQTWDRINASRGQGPANACRVDEASARELGVHPAIPAAEAADELPRYITRDYDERLRDLMGRGADFGCFLVLLGSSSCGKTRSLYEAVRDVVPDWWLVQPNRPQDIRDLLAMPTERTVLWLDELQRYLTADQPLRKSDLVMLVRAGVIVVGTLWPDHYFSRKRLRDSNGNDLDIEGRLLLEFAELIPVPEVLTAGERQRASQIAVCDSRVEAALAVTDTGLTQVLAAGLDLVGVWEQAPDPFSRAVISAAADARGLGIQNPQPAGMLANAMAGYLPPARRTAPPSSWLEHGLRHATSELHGAVSALTLVAGEQAGFEGYVIADYLTQHIGRVRRCERIPESLWDATVTHAYDIDDLRRLASAALVRMRYGYAERALRRLHDIGDLAAATELATVLRRQDRLAEAFALVDGSSSLGSTGDGRRIREELLRVYARAEQFRQAPESDATSKEWLWELLWDGGRADALRTRAAAAGDAVAADDLADLLAERGCLAELRQRADDGHRYATDLLADLLVSHGRAEELGRRADAGDRAAQLRLDRLSERGSEQHSAGEALARLRAAADRGVEEAAIELVGVLFDLGDQRALLAEVNAGTYTAAERYLAFLNASGVFDRSKFVHIRAFGFRADGQPVMPGETT